MPCLVGAELYYFARGEARIRRERRKSIKTFGGLRPHISSPCKRTPARHCNNQDFSFPHCFLILMYVASSSGHISSSIILLEPLSLAGLYDRIKFTLPCKMTLSGGFAGMICRVSLAMTAHIICFGEYDALDFSGSRFEPVVLQRLHRSGCEMERIGRPTHRPGKIIKKRYKT